MVMGGMDRCGTLWVLTWEYMSPVCPALGPGMRITLPRLYLMLQFCMAPRPPLRSCTRAEGPLFSPAACTGQACSSSSLAQVDRAARFIFTPRR